jgi:formylglycine-generating enzyme required for sulfatase activity
MRAIQQLTFVFILLLSLSTSAKQISGFDIVTMKNGDIHQGTAAIEFLSIKTPFATLAIPYHQLYRLKIGDKNTPDQLITHSGEILYGQVIDKEITMLRVLDATLPLATNSIASVTFASLASRAASQKADSKTVQTKPSLPRLAQNGMDIIKTRYGDQLLGNIASGDLILKSSTSMQLIKRNKIRFIDIATTEDKEILLQVTLLDGSTQQGQLSAKSFKFTSAYGEIIKFPLEALTELRYAVNADTKADFSHRWQKAPASLFQDTMIDGSLAPEMLIIQGGEFMRGDAQGDDDEKPPARVKLASFAIGVFEITFSQYDRFCTETKRDKPDDEGWLRGNRPVINVSWKDAKAYTEWLSKKTRQQYRLPTDAEWEYAARAGTQSKFWWGDQVSSARANCEGCQSLWDGAKTAPVGKFPANPFGLHDTAGNVFEWVADCFHDRFADAPADGSAIEKAGCGKRVIRGGAWSFPPKEIRSANRWRDFPSRRSDDTGFRIARDFTDTK